MLARVEHPFFFDRRKQLVNVATRIDDGGDFAFIAPNDGAILLKLRDGDGGVMQHTASVAL
jgi:hypothetical protein